MILPMQRPTEPASQQRSIPIRTRRQPPG